MARTQQVIQRGAAAALVAAVLSSTGLAASGAPAAPAKAPTAGIKDTFSGVARVVAVGDIHGDYEQFLTALRLCRIIDQRGAWAGGKAHLVQTGDVTDRGPDSRKVMDHLLRLEPQARRAGGRVHALIGNHEAMNVFGDLRYVSDEEFAAFGDPQRGNAVPAVPLADYPRHREAFSATGTYGRWLRGQNAVIKINGTLFLHGGLSTSFAATPLRTINDAVRAELSGARDFRASDAVAMNPDGPLWYRGLALAPDEQALPVLQQVLAGQKARRIVMGHTIQEQGIKLRFNGQLALIDVGMSRRTGGNKAACLIIDSTAAGDKLTPQQAP